VAAGLAGTPLMLCSCCITPIFQSVYERGARLGSALAVMLASPGLNPAALLLTAILFPPSLAVARIAAVLVAVFGLAPLVERTVGAGLVVADGRFAPLAADDSPRSLKETVARFAGALGYLTVRTVPLVLGGVLLSSPILPVSLKLSTGGTPLVVAFVAAVAVLVALPTFFEIPLAMLFLGLGSPGAAAAMLVAGPIVNLPSLLVLGVRRVRGWRWPWRSASGCWRSPRGWRCRHKGGLTRPRHMTEPQIFGTHEPNTLEQLRDVASRADARP